MRLTTNKPTMEMTMLELACNCVYEKDRRFFYKNYHKEIPLTEFMEYLSDKLGGTLVTAGVNEEAVIDELWDNLMNPITNADGLIAFIFRSLAAIGELREKLKTYEDLEEKGNLLKLPCKVGDMVWDIDFGRPCRYEVTGFSFGSMNDGDWEEERILDQVVVYYTNSNGSITGTFAVSEIGKTVFLTKEEAEQALCANKVKQEEKSTELLEGEVSE